MKPFSKTSTKKNKENLDYLLKIEKKNREQQQQNFDKKLNKIDEKIENLEKELNESVNNLNEQEEKIYEIQKKNIEKFKNEILKYENIYNEIKEKSDKIGNQIDESEKMEKILYNQTFMIKEDYLSHKNELNLLKENVENKLEILQNFEEEFPKEFKFIQEDFQLENNLNNLKQKNSYNNKQIKNINKQFESNIKNRNDLISQFNSIKKINNFENEINKIKNDNNLISLENELKKYIQNLLLWNNLKNIIKNFFGQNKNFDNKNFLNILHQNLTQIKNDFLLCKKIKLSEKNSIDEKIQKIKKTKIKFNEEIQQKNFEEISNLQNENEKIIQILNQINKDEKEIEKLFNKFIYLVKNNDENIDLLPRFKNEIINLIALNNPLNSEENAKILNLIDNFFDVLNQKETNLNQLKSNNEKINNELNDLNIKINNVNDKINNNENLINNLKNQNNQIKHEINIINLNMSQRDKNLLINLQNLGDIQFKNYLDSNKETLKNMKKIYGAKVLNKVFKVQKEKFLEKVILSHSNKKNEINNYIFFINSYNEKVNQIKTEMENLDNNFQMLFNKFENCLSFQNEKKHEKKILDEAKNDLKNKMQLILQDQIKEISIEKSQLQLKYNVNFYLEKIKEINQQINALNEDKKQILQDFDNFSKNFNNNEYKLQSENIQTNNFDENNFDESKFKTPQVKKNQIISIDETIKRTLNDFNKVISPELLNNNFPTSNNYFNSTNNSNSTKNSFNNARFLLVQKIRPLINGINLYKRFNNNFYSNGKDFDPLNCLNNPPENCGYGMRMFKLNTKNKNLEIKLLNQTNKNHFETSDSIFNIKNILLGKYANKIIKAKEKKIFEFDHQTQFLLNNDFICFSLVFTNYKIDLIAPNYFIYNNFASAIKTIINNQENVNEILDKM